MRTAGLPRPVPGTMLALDRAAASDVPAIVTLLADDPLGHGREADPVDPVYAAAFDAIDADPHQLQTVLRAPGGTVCGCAQLTFTPGLARGGVWRCTIEAVRVAPSVRGAGTGTTYFHELISLAREHGCGLVQLTTDKTRRDARRFYARLGFVASHGGMKLQLDPVP